MNGIAVVISAAADDDGEYDQLLMKMLWHWMVTRTINMKVGKMRKMKRMKTTS